MRFAMVGSVLMIGLVPSATAGQGADNAGFIDFFLGQWSIESLSPTGERIGRAKTEVRRILDDTALQSDYFALDRQGNTIFRGTTIRTYAPALGGWVVHWAMAGLPGYTYLHEKLEDGALVAEGHGVDGEGEFEERYRYFDISDSTYTFQMERSYDNGATWRQYAHLRATRPVGGQ